MVTFAILATSSEGWRHRCPIHCSCNCPRMQLCYKLQHRLQLAFLLPSQGCQLPSQQLTAPTCCAPPCQTWPLFAVISTQDLFKYIGKYKPQIIELSSKLKPFIPEFIPAIGGTDEFIKVPRPDGRPDYLGLKVGLLGNSGGCWQPTSSGGRHPLPSHVASTLLLVLMLLSRCFLRPSMGDPAERCINCIPSSQLAYSLWSILHASVYPPNISECRSGDYQNTQGGLTLLSDLQVLDEPAAVQSDPALLNLQLRQLSKDTPGVRMEVVGRIEHNDKDKQQRLAAWISSIADIHKSKAASAVRYSKPMPDIEVLMQASGASAAAATGQC